MVQEAPQPPGADVSGRERARPGDSADVTGLAATLAALAPGRQAWRNDILITAIVDLLSRKEHLSARELRNELRALWISRTTDIGAVNAALAEAEQADLVHSSTRPKGEVRWRVTAAAKEEAEGYRRRAQALLEQFKDEVGQRLARTLLEPLLEGRVARLTRTLVKAMASASERVFDGVKASRNPHDLTEVRYNLKGLADQIRAEVSPAQQAEALVDVAVAAADPLDEFGNELLRLIVSGHVLHGMLSRRDMPPGPAVDGTLLVLDTSFLVMSVEQDPGTRAAFDTVLAESLASGCRVVVTRDVLDEWERMWVSADDEEPEALVGQAPVSVTRLLRSHLLRSYAAAHAASGTRWRAFCGQYRPIEMQLTAAGVEVLETPPADTRVHDAVRDELLRLTAEMPSDRSGRSFTSASVDAVSAAHVAAARQAGPLQSGLPAAWFMGKERLTGRAYRNVVQGDPYPLTVTAQSWLLFMSASVGQEGTTTGIVEVLSEAVILDSFLSVATSYTPEDIGHIAGTLDGDVLDDAMGAEMLRARFEPDADDTQQAVMRAADLIRRRAKSRSRSADAEVQAAREREAAADARAAEAEARAEDARQAAAAPTPATAPAPDPAAAAAARVARRQTLVVAVVGIFVAALLTLRFAFDKSDLWLAPAYFAFAFVVYEGWQFTIVSDGAKKFWAGVIGSALYMLGGGVATEIYDASKDEPRKPESPADSPATPRPSRSGPPQLGPVPMTSKPAALSNPQGGSMIRLKPRMGVTDSTVGTDGVS